MTPAPERPDPIDSIVAEMHNECPTCHGGKPCDEIIHGSIVMVAGWLRDHRAAAPAPDAGLREAAQNLYDHIVGGMENGSHLPGDLCVRQLGAALSRQAEKETA